MPAPLDQLAATKALLRSALIDGQFGDVAVVSSFGADSGVLLDLVARIKPDAPVLFINTHMLFAETLAYKSTLTRHLGLTNVRTISPSADAIREKDQWGRLHLDNPDACCDFRKSKVLDEALEGFTGWITGRKRFQAVTRSQIEPIEKTPEGKAKLNPLARWTENAVAEYAALVDLPQHPLLGHGYKSIGCASCTGPLRSGEDSRAGRWRNTEKTECGIHFHNGKPVSGDQTHAAQ